MQSLPGAQINGAINCAIARSAFKGSATVPLSEDSIGSPGITAVGTAATTVFALPFIVTSIAFFVSRSGARNAGSAPAVAALDCWPRGLGIALRNKLLAFGAFIALAVQWQSYVGTVQVGPLAGSLVVAAVAVCSTAVAEWRTKGEMLVAGHVEGGRS